MRLRTKLTLASMAVLLVLAASLTAVGAVIITRLVDRLNRRLLSMELENVMMSVREQQRKLRERGLHDTTPFVEEAQAELAETVFKDFAFGHTGRLHVIAGDGDVFFDGDAPRSTGMERAFMAGLAERGSGFAEYRRHGSPRRVVAFDTYEPWHWVIVVSVHKSELLAERNIYLHIASIIGLAFLFGCSYALHLFAGTFTSRILRTLHCVRRVGRGDLTARIEPLSGSDEVGRLQRGVNAMVREIERRTAESRQAEDALRESEAKYRTIYDNAQVGLWRMRLGDGRITECNERYAEMLGFTVPTAVMGQVALADLYLDVAEYRWMMGELERGGRIRNFEARMRRPGGDILWVRYSARLYAERGFVEGVATDITEEKHAVEELAASERRYRSLFANMLNGFAYCRMVADEEGSPRDFVFVEVNSAFEQLTDASASAFIGRHAGETASMFSRELAVWRRVAGGVLATREPSTFEHYDRERDRWFSVGVYSPAPEHFVILLSDVTERRKAAEEIRRLNAELERRVAERTAELVATNKELESFCYAASHDLRAPLRRAEGFSRALAEDHAEELDGTAQDYLRRICEATETMRRLIDDLLKLSRVTQSDMTMEPVDLSELVREVVAAQREREPGRETEVTVEDGVVVRGDARLLRVAMENLVGNAWKFTRGREDARIEFGTDAADGAVACFVRDNGAGFDMAFADKLFSPFQRLHSVSEFEGSGIGLATVQRIVRRHGGRIWAEGAVGEGAVFHFALGPADVAADA